MITFIVFLLMLILLIYMVHTIFVSGLTFFINIAIILLIATKVASDMNKGKMVGYYLIASFITVFLLVIESNPIVHTIFKFFYNARVMQISLALISILFFANLIKVLDDYYKKKIKGFKFKFNTKLFARKKKK